MWESLPLDLLSHIFSFLQPGSLVGATTTCRHWRACVVSRSPQPNVRREDVRPWFLAVVSRRAAGGPASGSPCIAYVPDLRRWRALPLDFLPSYPRVVSAVASGILLCRLGGCGAAPLALCNPFTRQHKLLPDLMTPRSSPAVGVVAAGDFFKLFVAGGATPGGYEATLEVYDSRVGRWKIGGTTPAGFAVRLTVWTPDQGILAGGVVYWMTAARAYSLMGLEVETGEWREVKAPQADRLQWAALVRRREGRLGLVGGCGGGEGRVWELKDGNEWVVVGEVPEEAARLVAGGSGGGAARCVGSEGEVYLYGELGNGMAIGREVEGRWEWEWVDGCRSALGPQLNAPLRGILFHPCLSPSPLLR